MNKKFSKIIFFFIITLILSSNFVSSASAFVITTNYEFTNSSFVDSKVYKTDSVVLRIKTNLESECIYGTSYSLSNNFDGEYGLTHEAYLENLEEGFHEYYVRCGEISNPIMRIGFATSIPIYATIKVSEEPPLKEGKYKINLITSKTSLETPVLEYSFDEVVYKPISLKGDGQSWEGNLIIPSSVGESVCSFRFKAKDLAGEEGTKIVGDSSFIVDSSRPSTISILNAVGYQGQIKLNWYADEKVKEFNIYKSENPQLDYTNFYETTAKDYFYDNDVEKGKTYYYRIAGVDEAGNIGDLSREIYATALLSNSSKSNGLNPSLIGKVDNYITEINTIIGNVEEIKYLLESNEGKEEEIFREIKLDKEIESAISELNSLKRDAEGYKLQDLSLEELNKKLDSITLRLNIIRKKVPEDVLIKEEREVKREFNEEVLQRALLEYYSNTEFDSRKETNEILKLIEEKNIQVTGSIYVLEILYLDGTKKTLTLLKENIDSNLDRQEDLKFILVVPKEIAEKSSEMKMINLEYTVIKDDPVLSFNSDSKTIAYYINKEIASASLEDIIIAPIKIIPKEENSGITGNSIFESGQEGSFGIIILALFALTLAIYFLKIKKEPSLKPVLTIVEDIKKSKELLKKGDEKEAVELYNDARERYKLLNNKEKEAVMEIMKNKGVEM